MELKVRYLSVHMSVSECLSVSLLCSVYVCLCVSYVWRMSVCRLLCGGSHCSISCSVYPLRDTTAIGVWLVLGLTSIWKPANYPVV